MSQAQFDFVAMQEELRKQLNLRLKMSGVSLQRIADLDPDLKRGWVGGFSRGDIPTARIQKLQALQRSLDRLDEVRAFEAEQIAAAKSSSATA